jgi:hypothetical protein
MRVGDKIKMTGERQRYTVRAADARFAILTKPFNAKGTYLYTVVDLEKKLRGPCDLIFGPPAKLDNAEGAAEALAMLQTGEMGVSGRRNKPLEPEEIEQMTSEGVAR